MKFSYRESEFDLDERGFQYAYLTFLMNEDPIDFRKWHETNFMDYPDYFAWAIWKGFLKTNDNKMIYAGELK
jgi:hypothetical protein